MPAPSPTRRGRPSKGRTTQRFLLTSTLAGAVVAAMALPVVGTMGVTVKTAVAGFDALPTELESQPLPQRTYITAADGSPIATLYTENRVVVELNDISPLLQRAIIDVEDSRFYEHNGVDLKSTARAIAANSSAGSVQQGGSTITMQYVRNLLISNARTPQEVARARVRTVSRKLQEMRYAIALEKKQSKQEILAAYLNIAYFGSGAYGAEAASRRYFSVSANDLTLPQAATLAGLVQQPVAYDPVKYPAISTVRRNVVLDQMVIQGDVTPEAAAKAKAVPIGKTLRPREMPNGCTTSPYPFFCDYVIRSIQNDPRYGATQADREALLRRGGLAIKTGLQPVAQKSSTKAVMDAIPPTDSSKKAVALAMVQPGTGLVTAMAQNRLWGTTGDGRTTYNYAVDAKDGGTIGMQSGSIFKVFTLAAALEKDMSPTEYISSPQRKTFEAGKWGCPGAGETFAPYTVNNSTGSGTFNMWQGTALSINTYFVELQHRAGLCRTADIAERMGITLANGKPLLRYPSFTLGSMEVSALSMAAANAALANHGVYCRPHAVATITDLGGRTLFSDDGSCRRAVSREVADGVTALLTGVIDGSTSGRSGAPMSLGVDAAGKTGTTDSHAAVWFAGYTSEQAAVVWTGDPRGGFRYPMQNITINGQYYSKVYGRSIPGPVWKEAMLGAMGESKPPPFELEAKFGLKTARAGGVGGGGPATNYGDDYNYRDYYRYGDDYRSDGRGTNNGGAAEEPPLDPLGP